MDQLEHLKALSEEVAKLEHRLAPLRNQLTLVEWCELLRRDMEAEFLRKQNQLQEHIRHATQIIASRAEQQDNKGE